MNCNNPGYNCLCNETIDRELASGDNGTAYLLNSGQVLKKAFLRPSKKRNSSGKSFEEKKEDYYAETSTGIALGNIGIAPKIYKYWECESDGYYTMDLLTGVLNENIFLNGTNGISAQQIQYGIIMALCTMVQNGYTHQDCHFGNIGLIGEKVVLFDFGFTKRFNDQNHILDVLVSQLYIVIEQLDDPYFYNNYLYLVIHLIKTRQITSLNQFNNLSFQQPSFQKTRIKFDKTDYEQIVFIKEIIDRTLNIQDHVTRYCVIQKVLYEYLEGYTIFYDSIVYDCIYDFRQSKSLYKINQKLAPVINTVFNFNNNNAQKKSRIRVGGKTKNKKTRGNKKTRKRTLVRRQRR